MIQELDDNGGEHQLLEEILLEHFQHISGLQKHGLINLQFLHSVETDFELHETYVHLKDNYPIFLM